MKFHVENMVCKACVKHITQAICALDPNAKIEADLEGKMITVRSKASPQAIEAALAADDYIAHAA